jgi:hypothetical protein
MKELEFADSPNIHEILGEEKDCPSCIMPVAGLQYYSYDDSDELIGKVRPKSGDRLQLIRKPKNAYDQNAIEVWYRDSRFMLGHVPSEFACYLAEDLDSGKNVRAYCVNSGNGEAWSVEIILFHSEMHRELHDLFN